MRSYTSITGPKDRRVEFLHLWRRVRHASKRITLEVAELIDKTRDAEKFVKTTTGFDVENVDALEIGTGQLPRQTAYFARRNRVIGIDADVIPVGFDPVGYVRLVRSNGLKRATKTVVRKLIGFDRRFHRELCAQLGVARLPAFQLVQMDAARLIFADHSFDFVYSFSVFEHLPDPIAVLREIRRVLRPGGVCLTHLHLYTSDNGSHDIRINRHDRSGLPYWAHLRPESKELVQAFAYLNKIRLGEWRSIFEAMMPGCHFAYERDGESHQQELASLRKAGLLQDYLDDELLTRNLLVAWKKPSA